MRGFKVILIISLSWVLSACVYDVQAEQSFERAVEEALSQPVAKFRNMNRDLFSYYLPVHMGRRPAGPASAKLISRNQVVMLNVDVINVLNQSYYRDISNPLRNALNKEAAFFVKEGFMVRNDGVAMPYALSVTQLSDALVFAQVQTDSFIISSFHPPGSSVELLKDMILLARTVRVNQSVVLATYSNREILTFQRESLNIFAQVAPESGTVIDMITDPDSLFFDETFSEDSFIPNPGFDTFE